MSHYGEYCNAHFGEFSSLFCMALFHYFYGLKREYIERFLKTWWSFIFNNKVSAGACVLGGPFADSKHWSKSLFSLWWGSWTGSCSSTKWCKAATTSIYKTSTALFRAPLLYCERPRLFIGYSSILSLQSSWNLSLMRIQIRIRLLTLIRNRDQLSKWCGSGSATLRRNIRNLLTYFEVC